MVQRRLVAAGTVLLVPVQIPGGTTMMRWMTIATTVQLAACLPEPPEVLSYELSYGECLGGCRHDASMRCVASSLLEDVADCAPVE
jgi:hypothetical protein